MEKLLTPNRWSRPQKELDTVKGLVIHWVGNPGTSAEANWMYFENRKNGNTGYGSAHYIIGLKGEVIHCIPDSEMAYHVGAKYYTEYALEKFGAYPNNCTIGIETCHLDDDGNYSTATLLALHDLCVSLCKTWHLRPMGDITTHHAITHKVCPKFFVDHPRALTWLKCVVFDDLQKG
jgi:N-acetylmuramoyl-L-alanine amidase CwlA